LSVPDHLRLLVKVRKDYRVHIPSIVREKLFKVDVGDELIMEVTSGTVILRVVK